MKGFTKTLRDIFRPVAMAVAAISLAIPLLAGSALPADAKVMDTGPASLVLKQLKGDGYEPVGAGLTADKPGEPRLVSIWKDADGDWIATSGNKSTMKVEARGTDLSVGQWAPVSEISFEDGTVDARPASHGPENAASPCIPFDTAVERVLSRQFVQANLIKGTMDGGAEMHIYEEDGLWLSVTVQDNDARTTCPVSTGHSFKFAAPFS